VDVNVRAFRTVEALSLDARKVSAREGGLVRGPSRARAIGSECRIENCQEGQPCSVVKNEGRVPME